MEIYHYGDSVDIKGHRVYEVCQTDGTRTGGYVIEPFPDDDKLANSIVELADKFFTNLHNEEQ